jgi:tRNA G18 (ribose-2'-O)-methylase SpoU
MTKIRNVIDHYAYWRTEAIKAELNTRRHPFGILISNLQNDFNIGTVIRSANAFLAREVIICGRKKYDRRGTVGTHHYENLRWVKEEDVAALGYHYNLVAIDNVDGAEPIETFKWPTNPLMLFGQEQGGLPSSLLSIAAHKVYIRQYGSVRSLNVGSAASIAMYDWCVKNG